MDEVNYHVIVMQSSRKVPKKWRFLDTGDNPDSHQNINISFCLIYNGSWDFHTFSICGVCVKLTTNNLKIQTHK